MRIDIKNFSAVCEASIKCDGLTVIAGENDTGKSTVGKLIFSIVKSISRFESDFGESKRMQYFKFSKSINSNIINILKSKLYLVSDFSDFHKSWSNYKSYFYNDSLTIEEINEYIDGSISIFNQSLLKKDISKFTEKEKQIINEAKEGILNAFVQFQDLLIKYSNKTDITKKAFRKALISEFKMEISSKFNSSKSIIKWYNSNREVLETSIENDKIIDFKLFNGGLEFDDVTFIESPIILQLFEIIDFADTLFDIGGVENKGEKLERLGRPKVSLHLKDLMTKLKSIEFFYADLEDENKTYTISKSIQEIITGKFDFSRGDSDFLFGKETEKGQIFNLKSINTASGIKAFGIIQLLILSGIVDEKSLLVVDEPETHLHPKWQIAYAQILVELVKNDIKVLVTSHSPYFIQAVKYYSKIEGITDKVNYYLAERHDAHSNNINDVTDDLNQIFIKLSEPFQKLVW